MVSKNNIKCVKHNIRLQYGLRKLSVGVVSVLVGVAMTGVMIAHADDAPTQLSNNNLQANDVKDATNCNDHIISQKQNDSSSVINSNKTFNDVDLEKDAQTAFIGASKNEATVLTSQQIHIDAPYESSLKPAYNINLKWINPDDNNREMTANEQDDFTNGHNLGVTGSFDVNSRDLIPKYEINLGYVNFNSPTDHYLNSMENSADKTVMYHGALLGRVRYTGKALVLRVDDKFDSKNLVGSLHIDINNMGVIWLNDHSDFSTLGVNSDTPYYLNIQLITPDQKEILSQTTIHYSLKNYEHEFHYPADYIDKWVSQNERDFQVITNFVSHDQIDTLLANNGVNTSIVIPENVTYYMVVTPVGNSSINSLSANVRRNVSTFNENKSAFNNLMVSTDDLSVSQAADNLTLKQLNALDFKNGVMWSKQNNGQALVVVHYAPLEHKLTNDDWQQVAKSDTVINLLSKNSANALVNVKRFYSQSLGDVDPYNVISLKIPTIVNADNIFNVAKVDADGNVLKSVGIDQKPADTSALGQTQINLHFISGVDGHELMPMESFIGWPKDNTEGKAYSKAQVNAALKPNLIGYHYRLNDSLAKIDSDEKFDFKHVLINNNQDIMLDYPSIDQSPIDYYFILDPDVKTATVRYIDDETGHVLKEDISSGRYDSSIKFKDNPLSVIANYQKQNYLLISNNFSNQKFNNGGNIFEVHLLLKKHETGDSTTMDELPTYDINKLKKHETGDSAIMDELPTYDVNKLKKHETGDSTNMDELPTYDTNKLKKHETGDSTTMDELSTYDINKLKKHETGDSTTMDELPTYDINKLKKHETGDSAIMDELPTYDANSVNPALSSIIASSNSASVETNKLPQTGNQTDWQLLLTGLFTLMGTLKLIKRKKVN